MARARRAPFFQANLGVFGSGRLTHERPRMSWRVSIDDQLTSRSSASMRALRRRFRNGRYHRYNARYVRPEKGLFMAHTPTYRGTGVGTVFQKRSCANKNALLIDVTVDICVAVADGLAKDASLMRAARS